MLVNEYIGGVFDSVHKGLSGTQIEFIGEMCEDLRQFGERWGSDIIVPELRNMRIPFLIERDGLIIEVYMDFFGKPLEGENRRLLRYFDEKLAGTMRKLKSRNFDRISIMLFGFYHRHIYAPEIASIYDGEVEKWCGVELVLRRLRGTARAGVRYENEKFCDRVIEKKNGEVSIIYGKGQWRSELVRRGVIPKAKRKR